MITPEVWFSTWRTVICSLPAAANAGQYSATGASTSTCPRSASTCIVSAVGPLVVENTDPKVSSCQGTPGRASPPHRSTTARPPA